ncbi:hypothetical protein [Vibrio parahaemolyticus]|uniref:hypothetical protein n=1 Tax=Vibrio parahaemolyticus TaxID=670 RepID=UPI002269B5C5|nr:hypothetical protein [Vibrio parahaemolyticus]MCX8764654.1 hypothetical protein [Vibrio parahaemolyticus]MCX8780393.1 hypothetical protein [Vibrio parahaemolyticus]
MNIKIEREIVLDNEQVDFKKTVIATIKAKGTAMIVAERADNLKLSDDNDAFKKTSIMYKEQKRCFEIVFRDDAEFIMKEARKMLKKLV